ncbi:hypothetical protein, partial [Burkholderia cepacia]|uniref:hypothetical protein n=1 Tax=Burkholderia cepacia TaxID=292 RepID=UPI000A8A296C
LQPDSTIGGRVVKPRSFFGIKPHQNISSLWMSSYLNYNLIMPSISALISRRPGENNATSPEEHFQTEKQENEFSKNLSGAGSCCTQKIISIDNTRGTNAGETHSFLSKLKAVLNLNHKISKDRDFNFGGATQQEFTIVEQNKSTTPKTRRGAGMLIPSPPVDTQRISKNGESILAHSRTMLKTNIKHNSLPAATKLSRIAMLGSHDAGTYMFSRQYGVTSLGATIPQAFKTQSLNLVEQAGNGVRYFDIRIRKLDNGNYGFFHGPSATPGGALTEVRKLLEHARKDKNDFYILKFDFYNDESADFVRKAIMGSEGEIISTNESGSLGDVTVGESLQKGKNIVVLGKMTSKKIDDSKYRDIVWSYNSHVFTKWGNDTDSTRFGGFIRDFIRKPEDGKLKVTQTNIPFWSKKNPFSLQGVKVRATSNHSGIASVIETARGVNPGVILIDYVGDDAASSTNKYLEIVNKLNKSISYLARSK